MGEAALPDFVGESSPSTLAFPFLNLLGESVESTVTFSLLRVVKSIEDPLYMSFKYFACFSVRYDFPPLVAALDAKSQ